ncbi:MAG TPA: CCA tRNA nucleotidyltransferase [Erysipelothrix sp.]|nr:CCA tRNA nucleotidyltransferase [Erysipelothrix sp.]
MIIIDEAVKNVLSKMNQAGIEAYLVGGYIRDLLLKKKSFDIDICFRGSLDELAEIFQDCNLDLSAQQFHSLSFSIGDFKFECSHFRKESEYENHRHPSKIELVNTLQEDLIRRDFTINSIAFSLEDGLVDTFGGMGDLQDKVLKTIKDAQATFKEDYLRIFRAYRFKSQLGFNFDDASKEALISLLPLTYDYPVQWWQVEFEKMIMGQHFLSMALEEGDLLKSLFPIFIEAYDWDQRNPYHLYSLYEHTMRVVAHVPYDIRLRYAALFHDCGKLTTEVHDDKGISHYPGHAEASYEYAKDELQRFQMKKKDRDYILKLIRYHGVRMPVGIDTVYKMAVEHGSEFLQDLILLKKADNISKSEKGHYQIIKCDQFMLDLEQIIAEAWPLRVKDLQVKGDDCIALGVEKKNISKVLTQVLNTVVARQVGNDLENQYSILKEVISNVIY